MDVGCVPVLTQERLVRTSGHRDILDPKELEEFQGVHAPYVEAHITRDSGQALDPELRGAEGEEDRQGIVDSGIGIDQNMLQNGFPLTRFSSTIPSNAYLVKRFPRSEEDARFRSHSVVDV
jgi:hypothetical protein